jgi:hypothetical protein
VIRAAHQRTGLDVTKSDGECLLFQRRELVGRDVALDREMIP